jgi:hypothetical protein
MTAKQRGGGDEKMMCCPGYSQQRERESEVVWRTVEPVQFDVSETFR